MAEKKTNGSLALNERQVITIAPAKRPESQKLRVAAYARVSSASDDQKHSFAAQVRYYTDLIAKNPNWSMVDLYADEGLSGRSAEKRPDFQRMLEDCRRGLIDRILVKSISRFARNTTDCLQYIRELRQLGVSIFFEKENIDTGLMTGEMLTALFAALAQSASQSISSNEQWSYQKRMQLGLFKPSSLPYGYRYSGNQVVVQPEEAKNVELIFGMFLAGTGKHQIARIMNELNIPTRRGKLWNHYAVEYILRNERYIGDSLWQKSFVSKSFPPQKIKNNGQVCQYYVSDTHPSIICREQYKAAQLLIQRKTTTMEAQRVIPAMMGNILCGKCNSFFRRKKGNSKMYWVCHTHDSTKELCDIQQIEESVIHTAFFHLYYKLKHNPQLLTTYLSNYQAIRNRRLLWSVDVIDLNKKISDLYSQNQRLAKLNARGLIDPDIFISQANDLTEELRSAKLQKERLLKVERDHTVDQTEDLIETLDAGPDFLDAFDGELFGEIVDKIIVDSNEQIRFRLKNGLELPETIERTKR